MTDRLTPEERQEALVQAQDFVGHNLSYGPVLLIARAFLDSERRYAEDTLTETEARLAIILALALHADGVALSEIPTRAITELRAASGGAGLERKGKNGN